MKKLSIAIVGLLAVVMVFAGNARVIGAQESKSAETTLKNNIDAVLEILENPDLDEQQKKEKIEDIVDPIFDYQLMAMLSLGRQNWSRLSPDQQQTFTNRFVKRLKASYFDKISMYSKDLKTQMNYKPAQTSGSKVRIPVEVNAKEEKVNLVYKFYQSDAGWQIYDVEINGVSIIQSYRSQFNQVLSRGTVEDLLEELKQPAEPQSTQ